MERLIVLDTETTGLDVDDGHKIIEIGCVEIIDRNITTNVFHEYVNPKRLIDEKAYEVHGISNDSLEDKPIFSEILDKFMDYISDSALIIHNAPFDIGFLRAELYSSGEDPDKISIKREILDTLKIARKSFPGKRNSLDALCVRYAVDNTDRNLHGALLDARLLANVYLRMTQGQTNIEGLSQSVNKSDQDIIDNVQSRTQRVIRATSDEVDKHLNYFK
ncbi:MAG: DNA polymerase III subunit epsilon [Gammaproteobacteria bacterium]|nr:DNA polymerase III subunit epsilon [Gammaproteobacteria bacterium]MBT5406118.1 DNA polymerase III subunit epsilon [Gammaproteobacteria bacterium]MBT5863899.1 DNA polymerase III subunit epsilon [Gammaproteobacteria bacterium]MBT6733791.1 DNA polymerase III subunit epsilon [Gammaproteobacteria bacterium]|tara:strand:- start:1393 stop:2049 length:657 start_codon:yes stop_codon:yes gene_type:complete